jgi:hypothetical protein
MTTTEELLEVVFSIGFASRLHSENPRPTSNDVNREAGEASFLRSVTRKRLVKAN